MRIKFILTAVVSLQMYCPCSFAADTLAKYIKASVPARQAFALLVPKETTKEQLKSMILSVKEAHEKGELKNLGFEPTTPKGKLGPYAVIDIWVFKDPKWATAKMLNQAYEASGGSKFEHDFNQKVEAHYLYTAMGTEEGSVGYEGNPNHEVIVKRQFRYGEK